MRLLFVLLLVASAAYLLGGAVDYEQGRAGMLPDNSAGGTGMVEGVSRPERVRGGATPADFRLDDARLIEGRNIYWWRARAVRNRREANQQRRNSMKRGQTIRRLQSAQRNDAAHLFAWLRGAECVHSKEGAWDDPNPPYWGGMQADMAFQRAYGRPYLQRWGTADNWPVWAQLHMAYNGWVARGWQPWPNTARECGLL